ncbi:MAG: pyrimidine/purine nucleoside phosphorylase [Firmicutes bacterium]|nr:pyrimidine/purine nucleoside phosphorylase [Bacillota bacterium]
MEFKNATVTKKANIYFGGKVSSRTIIAEDGVRYTLGFMLPGEYEFNTGAAEVMEMLGGSMDVLLPGATEYAPYGEGQAFNVPANSSFKVVVKEFADYCCYYAD